MTTRAAAKTPVPGRDYGYGNARVRGMRSRLLDGAFLEGLVEAADVPHIFQLLADTEYQSDVETEALKGRTPATMDEALAVNIVRTFRKIMGFLNTEAYGLVTTLLGRWDLFNIKSIIRGKHVRLTADEIEDGLYAVGTLGTVDLRLLAGLQDARSVVDTLLTWGSPYGEPLRESLPKYESDGDLAQLELALDRFYYAWAAERLTGRGVNAALARGVLGLQVDSINLLSTFRLLKSDIGDVEPSMFFLDGGAHISRELFLQMAALSDVDEVLDALKSTPYTGQLEGVVVRYEQERSIAVFERALEDYVLRKALDAGRGDPLGIGIVIGYLWAKQNEVTNLRIIVKGNSVGMPADRMRKELILV